MSVMRWEASYPYPGIEPVEYPYPEGYVHDEQKAARATYVLASDYDTFAVRLTRAEATIEGAAKCLVMSNNGAREALTILRGYKQTADSADFARLPICKHGWHIDPRKHSPCGCTPETVEASR